MALDFPNNYRQFQITVQNTQRPQKLFTSYLQSNNIKETYSKKGSVNTIVKNSFQCSTLVFYEDLKDKHRLYLPPLECN